MDWLKRIFHKPVVTVGEFPSDPFDPSLASLHGLRRGMWVVVRNAARPVGIITALSAEGSARIMLVDGKGENRMELDLPVASLQQACWTDIPAARRPPKRTAEAYGYKVRPR